MDRSDREFTYKSGLGMMTLLGILMLILGPLCLWIFAQTGPETNLGARKRIPFVPDAYQIPAAGILLLLVGGAMVYSGLKSGNRRARIRLMEDRLVVSNPASGAADMTIRYDQLKEIVVTEGRQGKTLSFHHPNGRLQLAARGMNSTADFEVMCALIQERASPAISA